MKNRENLENKLKEYSIFLIPGSTSYRAIKDIKYYLDNTKSISLADGADDAFAIATSIVTAFALTTDTIKLAGYYGLYKLAEYLF
mgnify:CR=1 FL=1